MKETIYTIPINEVYETDCECPLCVLEKKIEDEATDYALGAAMMEPDYRIESNEKGYCRRHFEELYKKPNKLSLALVMDTYTQETRKQIKSLEKKIDSLENAKGGLFKKSSELTETAEELAKLLENRENSCIVCDKINHTMDRYYDVLLDMWAQDDGFRDKFSASKGLCLHHMRKIVERVPKKLSEKNAKEFLTLLYKKQLGELDRIQEDIHRFTLKFDYRNKDMDWNGAQDAPIRTIEKSAGYIRHED